MSKVKQKGVALENSTPVPVTAVIKAKNEAHQIAECIESLRGFAAEIIVVDDNSSDDTVKIASDSGARIIHAKSKNRMINELDKIGFEAATQPWILRMDADERMTSTLAKALREAAAENKWAGVQCSRKNIMFGEWARYG
ncbi:MAG: glycosyltransferase, partial [Pseudomonadota bacterium]